MGNLFSVVLNMSMTGSIVILLVMLARLILKRAPKIFSYALWAVVLFRLLCPVALTAPVSVLNALEPKVQEASESTSVIYFIPAEVNQNPDFTFVPAENQSGTEPVQVEEPEHTRLDLMTVASYVWLAGTGIMIAYSVIQYVRLRLKLIGAMAYRGNVYRADYIDTPFVMGIFSPKIYLPSDVPTNERKYIIAHERHHISRCDHIIKLLAYFALCIHWFNPLVWAAFILAGKDMEMSCDEAVIKRMGSQIRADYSASLLRLATHKKIIAGMPLAFGEGDTKGRVMNMAKWKKPKLWVSIVCFVLCGTILVACAVNPKTVDASADKNSTEITGEITCADRLNIREEPDLLSAVVGNYYNGAIVTILETKDGWGRTDMGWISMDYVTTIDDTTLDDPAESTPVPNKLNIRKEPDASSAVVGQYSNGTTITILETKDRWGRTDQGWIVMDYVKTVDGITVVDTSDFQPTVDGSVIITDTDLVQYGTLKMLLPSGFAAKNEDNAVVLTKDSIAVGGIRHWNYPEFQPSDIVELKKEETGAPIGYMSGSSAYGDMEYEIFWDGNPEGLNEQHEFFIDGDIVYDVWYDQNLISDGIAERFLKTVAINADPVIEENPDEQTALTKCRAVLDAIQNGSCHIVAEESSGGDSQSRWSTSNYYQNNGNWLMIEDVDPEKENIVDGEQYSVRMAFMVANNVRYSNEGKWGKAYTDIDWREDNLTFNDSVKPWLASFQWDDAVAYMDTLTDANGECVMLRVDEKYKDSDEYDPHYFLYFNFDPDGNFVNAQLQINLFSSNELSITESIVSMDPKTVNAEIQKEYRRAIG
ncbi:MAG: SH3 domain-containing protein [Clostridiales bacterium]|nr:SH3 domain-containing protein [Clostridiales bacterium]